MFAYCENNPVIYRDPTGEDLLGAMIGGAIGGALISVVSHLATNPNATIGSTLTALGVGAVTGALGGLAGVLTTYRAVASCAVGLIAGVYAACTAEGDICQKVAIGMTTGTIAAVGTYCGSYLDTAFETTFETAASTYATTVFAGGITEPIAVASQRQLSKPVPSFQASTNNTPSHASRWNAYRQKESQLLFGN